MAQPNLQENVALGVTYGDLFKVLETAKDKKTSFIGYNGIKLSEESQKVIKENLYEINRPYLEALLAQAEQNRQRLAKMMPQEALLDEVVQALTLLTTKVHEFPENFNEVKVEGMPNLVKISELKSIEMKKNANNMAEEYIPPKPLVVEEEIIEVPTIEAPIVEAAPEVIVSKVVEENIETNELVVSNEELPHVEYTGPKPISNRDKKAIIENSSNIKENEILEIDFSAYQEVKPIVNIDSLSKSSVLPDDLEKPKEDSLQDLLLKLQEENEKLLNIKSEKTAKVQTSKTSLELATEVGFNLKQTKTQLKQQIDEAMKMQTSLITELEAANERLTKEVLELEVKQQQFNEELEITLDNNETLSEEINALENKLSNTELKNTAINTVTNEYTEKKLVLH